MSTTEESTVFTIDNEDVEISLEDLHTIQLGKRPEHDNKLMDYNLFKKLQRQIRREEKIRSKGVLFHLSKIDDKVWKKVNKEYFNKHGFYPTQKGATYVKRTKE